MRLERRGAEFGDPSGVKNAGAVPVQRGRLYAREPTRFGDAEHGLRRERRAGDPVLSVGAGVAESLGRLSEQLLPDFRLAPALRHVDRRLRAAVPLLRPGAKPLADARPAGRGRYESAVP